MLSSKTLLKLLIPLFLCGLYTPKLSAVHFLGAEIFYACLPTSNACTYRVFHHIYFDCGARTTVPLVPAPPIDLSFEPVSCSQPSMVNFWTLVSFVEVSPICPTATTQCSTAQSVIIGSREQLYYADYDFCNTNCTQYNIVWGGCCRNLTLSSGASNYGFYLGNTLIDLGLATCNSSPVFSAIPTTIICDVTGGVFDHSAYDPDGDSLAYSLIACLKAKNVSVSYYPGYSATQPMGPNWQVRLDAQTGALTILPNPGGLSRSLICIEVKEYRKGIQIGSITRDMEVAAINCQGTNKLPQLDSFVLKSPTLQLAPKHFEMCVNDTLKIDLKWSDLDMAQVLTLSDSTLLPGLKIIKDTLANPLTASVSFTSIQSGSFTIPLRIEDSNCPLMGKSTVNILVDVLSICPSEIISHAPCGLPVGAINLGLTQGVPPYHITWSNGDTTQQIDSLLPGKYVVTVIDSIGNCMKKTYSIHPSHISFSETINLPSCQNPLNGNIITNLNGGKAPYHYQWSNGDTTASLRNIPEGGYCLRVSDVYGCAGRAIFMLKRPDSCFNRVEGIVYDDDFPDCQFGSGESRIPYAVIDFTPGGATLADANGYYQYPLDTGTQVITFYPNPWQQMICQTNGEHQVSFSSRGNQQMGLDFAVFADPIKDLSVAYTQEITLAGDSQYHYLNVRNNGPSPINAVLNWEHDSIFNLHASYPAYNTYDTITQKARWFFINLKPYQSKEVKLLTSTSSNVSSGTLFQNQASVSPVGGDVTLENNSASVADSVRKVYTSNLMEVTPLGNGPLGLIEQSQQQMTYTIRFQNISTDTAFTLQIRDTIEVNKLNVFSFRRELTSHPYQLEIEQDSILVFRFDQINLPDSATNFAESNGFLTYGISHKGLLPIGTQIRNSAAISFDYKPPTFTNTTLNSIFAYPSIDLISSMPSCEGDTILAMISSPGVPPYDFQWSDGKVDLNNMTGISKRTIQGSGTYQVTVTDFFGLTANQVIQVTSLPLPDPSFSFSKIGLSVSFSDTSSVNTHWKWYFGDGQTAVGIAAPVHTYMQGLLYQVRLDVFNDCGSDTLIQEVDLRELAIGEALFAGAIRLYPHPVQDISYLQFDNPQHESYRLRILDLQGRLVDEYPATREDRFEILRKEMATGIYVYELIGDQSYFGKMIIR